MYSNGVSEIVLGKAIKKYNFPRDEIVVMTKLCGVVGRTPSEMYYGGAVNHEEYGYVNQIGSSRKVRALSNAFPEAMKLSFSLACFRCCKA